ncbi:MAG: hypothetical protein ACREVK_07060 [Gammaproteobacteria bacterium]
MNTLAVTIRYRPVRIGWCVRAGDVAAFREAVKLSYTMWGGRYNPIIPVDDYTAAASLVRLFRVDVLWPASDDVEVKAFIEKFPHLPNPFFREELFLQHGDGQRHALIADIYHPIRRCYEEHFKNNPDPQIEVTIHEWGTDDPLADVFLVSLGALPPAERTGTDYLDLLKDHLKAKTLVIPPGGPSPRPSTTDWRVSSFSRAYIKRHYSVQNSWGRPGFYIGNAADFDDLVNVWNLRAADTYLMFYDHAYSARLETDRNAWLETLRSRPKGQFESDNAIAIWVKDQTPQPDIKSFGQGLMLYTARDGVWNGLNVKAPYMYLSEGSTLGTIEERSSDQPRVSFQLPQKPFADDVRLFDQHIAVSIDPGIGLFRNERATLHTPHVPELNEYYGRQCFFEWDKARAEPESLAVITSAHRSDLSISALGMSELIWRLFAIADITAKQSQPGLIATRLIQQMRGIQGCRPFKIPGVRTLIEQHGPYDPFTRSCAIQTIRAVDPATNQPSFSAFEDIFVEPRPFGSKLKPEAVFEFFLKRGVFASGLEPKCPSCQLEFWLSIDDLHTEVACEYCGHRFNLTLFLKDRGDWRFRRSGLLGRDNNQQGAIPVALALLQLHTAFHSKELLFTTATKLHSESVQLNDCETDFVAIVQRPRDGTIDIAIGECKTRQDITEKDVTNLKAVADAFPRDRFNVYVVFSKLAPFTPEELAHIRGVNEQYRRRAILFTARELEPYHLYDRTSQEFKIDRYAVTFEDMANVTEQVFFAQATARPS